MRDEFLPEDLKRLAELITRANGSGLSYRSSQHDTYYDSSTGKPRSYQRPGEMTGDDAALEICRLLFDRRHTILTRFNVDETGWLIELNEKGEPPLWYKLGGKNRWTSVSTLALRFARKSDANAFMDANDLRSSGFASSISVTEHAWTAPSPTSSQDQGEKK